MDVCVHLNQYELAKRWRMSQRTLERWRWLGIGPAYIKVGGRVIYSIDDIKAYELSQRRAIETNESENGKDTVHGSRSAPPA